MNMPFTLIITCYITPSVLSRALHTNYIALAIGPFLGIALAAGLSLLPHLVDEVSDEQFTVCRKRGRGGRHA